MFAIDLSLKFSKKRDNDVGNATSMCISTLLCRPCLMSVILIVKFACHIFSHMLGSVDVHEREKDKMILLMRRTGLKNWNKKNEIAG